MLLQQMELMLSLATYGRFKALFTHFGDLKNLYPNILTSCSTGEGACGNCQPVEHMTI